MESAIDGKEKILSLNLFPVVGVGASAGGLDAFKKLVSAIPEKSGMAYVLVQHLDPNHESQLPALLQKVTAIPVLEISEGIKVEPDHIYIIPSNKMLVANDGILELSPRPSKSKKELNLPINLFFSSLAEVHQAHAIGVVLSGTASDGTNGLKAIKDNGGVTFAQDEASAAFDGMPHSAMEAGVVDFILPPEEIPGKIVEITQHISSQQGHEESKSSEDAIVFKQILSLLNVRKRTDFTYYKQTTIRRRILRRMVLNKIESLPLYLEQLRQSKSEQDILYQDLLIPVTSFFRDTETFNHLCKLVFPSLLESKPNSEKIRVWVAGCSTGEEAYSIAITIKEYLTEKFPQDFQKDDQRIQIFATDISELAVAKARLGSYTKGELEGVNSQRLKNFFTKSDEGYCVSKELREMCVFAGHNFLKDPPFGKMDLISCRNVLIYLESYLQKKALTTFHYALKPKGFLLLGNSESASGVPDLFMAVNKTEKLFTRKDVAGKYMITASKGKEQTLQHTDTQNKGQNLRTDFQKTADEMILNKYTPAGVVVNEAMDIVHFRGKTGLYLEQAPGKPSHNLLKMAISGLAFELRNILHKAKKDNASVLKENIQIETKGSNRVISIEAMPLPDIVDPHYLILFHEQPLIQHSADPSSPTSKNKKGVSRSADLRIQQLEKELAQTREDMRGITEDQEAANEELQSANEELLSSSEELQSINEELESSKEELQSTIEELTVVNQEIITLNEQVTVARNYSELIVATIREPLLVLDDHLRVKSANRSFYKTFQLTEEEAEKKVIYDLANKQWDIPALRELLEKILPDKESFFDFEVDYYSPKSGQRTMLLNAREMKGRKSTERLILLSIEDITERATNHRNEVALFDALKESELHFRLLADLIPTKISNAKVDGEVIYFNKGWLDFTGMSFEELKDFGYHKIMHPDEISKFQQNLQKASDNGTVLEMEMRFLDKNGDYIWHLNNASPVKDTDGKTKMWIGVTTDITEQINTRDTNLENYHAHSKELEEKVEERTVELSSVNDSLEQRNKELQSMNKELNSFTYVSSHDLQEPLRKIQTFAKLLLEKENENLTDKGKDYYERIKKAASRMQALIQDLLAFSRMSSGERKFEYTDLNKIVVEVIADFKETIEEKGATVEIRNLGSASVNPFQFRQLMLNLLGNSLKFSKTGTLPHIVIESAKVIPENEDVRNLKADKEYCNIKVSDNGIGFDLEYKDRIFELFQRLHGKDDYEGTGIGLSIVKRVVENHNGYIFATSELGKGATFDIYLPVEQGV